MCNLGKNTTAQKADSATPAQFRLNSCISAALIAENAHDCIFQPVRAQEKRFRGKTEENCICDVFSGAISRDRNCYRCMLPKRGTFLDNSCE